MSVIATIQSRIVELETEMKGIKDTVETDGRLMNSAEMERLEKAQVEHADLTRQSKLLNGVGSSLQAAAEPVRRPVITGGDVVGAKKGLNGFRNVAEYFNAVKGATQTGRVDNRLMNAASVVSSEGTSADGGYAVPDDLRRDIWSYVTADSAVLPLTDNYNSFSKTLTFPTDTVQPWSSQITASIKGENAALDESKIALGTLSVTAFKYAVMINATDELLEDANAMGQFISRKAGERLSEKFNADLLWGAGTTLPLGAFHANNSALKVVSSGTGQTAGTIIPKNIYDMYFAMPQQNRSNAVWVISPSAEPALQYGLNSGSSVPLFIPAGGLANQPYGTILGRPYIVNGNMKALGTRGDIGFVDFKKYLTLTKGDVKADVSIHVYFQSDVSSFRFITRMGGKPWLTAPITQSDGSTTLSPFVTLAAR